MKKVWQIIFGFLLAMVFLPFTFAALDLELTQGIRAAMPIAVVPFRTNSRLTGPSQLMETVIKNDLKNSGQFRVLESKVHAYSISGVSHLSVWRKQGANAVVEGEITMRQHGIYVVDLKLIGLYNKSAKYSSNIILSRRYQMRGDNFRGLAHRISDAVFQKLTGIAGIFSTKIAYISVDRSGKESRYLFKIADADGYRPKTLLISHAPLMSPAWAPDGQRIAYVSFENHKAAIFIQDINTGKRQKVSEAPGINGAPAFSPDGKKLAMVLSKSGNPKIYLLNLATHHLRQLTHGWSIDTEPAWSSKGDQLLFTSNRDGSPQIYRCNLVTGEIQRLTFEGDYNAKASFLPGDQQIIMMHRQQGMFGIAKQDLNSVQIQVLVQSGMDESPNLAPNGKMIIYATHYAGRGVLSQVSTDGRIEIRLPARIGAVQEPAWSPFLNHDHLQ